MARTIGSALYITQMMLYTSVAVYAPALALSHGKLIKILKCNSQFYVSVTGLNVYIAVSVVYLVCVFYASQVNFSFNSQPWIKFHLSGRNESCDNY